MEMTNISYNDEPIGLSWQTAPWNDPDGETIKKGTENADGNITMTELPSEVNEDELTGLREQIIRTAVRNPKLSTTQIDYIVDCGKNYSANVLSQECPDWYENTFKKTGKSTDKTRNDLRETDTDVSSKSSAEVLAEETGEDKEKFELDEDTEVPELDDLDSEPADGHARNYRSETTDSTDWKPYALVGLVSFLFGLLWGGRDD